MSPELRQRSILIALLLAAWAGCIVAKVYYPPTVGDFNALISYIQVLLGGIVGYHVGAGNNAVLPLAAPQPVHVISEKGSASWPLLAVLASVALGAALLAGCTTTTASVYSGLYTQARAGVQVFDDNSLSTIRDLLCAQPYAAIQRHPEVQPGVNALCGPLAAGASLDPAQVQLMLNLARQLAGKP